MNQELFDTLMEDYSLQRQKNAREEQRRLAQVTQKDPELAALLDSRREMILSFCRSSLLRPAAQDLPARMKKLNQSIRERLARDGFPEDYLEPVYRCEKCRDTGYQGDEERTLCSCLRQRLLALTDHVGTGAESFENFDETVFPLTVPEGMTITQREQMRLVRAHCERYADAFPHQRPRDLLLFGRSGLGKSYLLCCIAQRLRERGFEAELVSAYDAIMLLRDAYFGRPSDTDRLLQSDVLLLDDLGMEPLMENITLEQLFYLINARRSAGRAIVISTNLNLKELKNRYSERIASRLLDASLCQVIPLRGSDVRLIKREEPS